MEKFYVSCSEAFKVICTCSRNTPTQSTKTTQWPWPVEQLTDNVHLATSAWLFLCFALTGSHNQLCTFHSLINLLVTNLFYITPYIKWLKQLGVIKMACCKVCHGQLVACSVTWYQCCSEVQTSQSEATRSIEESSWRFLQKPITEKLPTVGKAYLKCSANLLEAFLSISNTLQSCIKNRL